MERFVKRHEDRLVGILTGFDRLVFRGSLLSIVYQAGMFIWLTSRGVLLKGFAAFAETLSKRIKVHGKALAEESKRPWIYVNSSRERKEDIARRIQRRDGIDQGLICVLRCLEPCRSYRIYKNAETKRLELRSVWRVCLHLYFYYMDRDFGFMHVRVQTWLPFTIQVCVNGREWLARQMEKRGIEYQQRDNCFTWIEGLPAAQKLMDEFGERKWAGVLNALARRVNPLLDAREKLSLRTYYWTIWQGEYATDLMFRDTETLAEIYPALVRLAVEQFRSPDVLRFLGRRTNSRFQGEVKSHLADRPEGIRVKHWVEENSIKMYDKQGSVLRIETTINNPRRFRVRRWATRNGQRVLAWVPMRKGIADMGRRVQVCRAANARYLNALADASGSLPARRLLDPVSRRVTAGTRSYRPLSPIGPEDSRIFEILQRGEFQVHGFRNRDLRGFLWPDGPCDRDARRRQSARVSRLLALLRAHGLTQKVTGENLYRVKEQGQKVMTVARRLRNCNANALAA